MPTLNITIKTSSLACILWLVLILSDIGILSAIDCAVLVKIAIWMSVMGYSAYLLWHVLLRRSQNAITSLSWTHATQWSLYTRGGKTLTGHLCGDSIVTSSLCFLRFTVHDRLFKRNVLLFRDALSQNDYRRLIMHLLHENTVIPLVSADKIRYDQKF